MKPVEYINFNELEKQYYENHNTWKIEEEILYSFSKEDLKKLIENTKISYLKDFMPYEHILMRKKFKEWYEDLNGIEKYFIELMEYYFNWWQELEITKSFLDRLDRFNKLNYQEKNKFKNYKAFDVNSVSIIDVLSNYMKIPYNLKRNIKCPLHKEKSWSFKIYKNTNSFYCFGCKSWWWIVEFVSEIENITKKEAYKRLAELYSNY